MMNGFIQAFKKYGEFNGRASRQEFWTFHLVNLAIAMLVLILGGGPGNSLVTVYGLVTLLPGIAVFVRRMHDTDRSGWWVLLGCIPILGLITLFFALQPGTAGPNRFSLSSENLEGDLTYKTAEAIPEEGKDSTRCRLHNFEGTAENEEKFWAAALAEFDSDRRRLGLWAKCFSQANGREPEAKGAYLSARVTEMQAAADVQNRATLIEDRVVSGNDFRRADVPVSGGHEAPNLKDYLGLVILMVTVLGGLFVLNFLK